MEQTNPQDPWLDRVADYVDEDMPARERLAFEEHLAGCAQCAALADAMRQVAARAEALNAPVEPPRDLWPGIRTRLAPRRRPLWSFLADPRLLLRPQLAAVIAILVLCVAGVWLLAPGPGKVADRTLSRPPVSPTSATATESDPDWQQTIARLQREAEARLTLDPHVAEVLDDNLATLDAAIAAYRDALAEHPANPVLRDRLTVARQKKLEVLQQAVLLTTEGTE